MYLQKSCSFSNHTNSEKPQECVDVYLDLLIQSPINREKEQYCSVESPMWDPVENTSQDVTGTEPHSLPVSRKESDASAPVAFLDPRDGREPHWRRNANCWVGRELGILGCIMGLQTGLVAVLTFP